MSAYVLAQGLPPQAVSPLSVFHSGAPGATLITQLRGAADAVINAGDPLRIKRMGWFTADDGNMATL